MKIYFRSFWTFKISYWPGIFQRDAFYCNIYDFSVQFNQNQKIWYYKCKKSWLNFKISRNLYLFLKINRFSDKKMFENVSIKNWWMGKLCRFTSNLCLYFNLLCFYCIEWNMELGLGEAFIYDIMYFLSVNGRSLNLQLILNYYILYCKIVFIH